VNLLSRRLLVYRTGGRSRCASATRIAQSQAGRARPKSSRRCGSKGGRRLLSTAIAPSSTPAARQGWDTWPPTHMHRFSARAGDRLRALPVQGVRAERARRSGGATCSGSRGGLDSMVLGEGADFLGKGRTRTGAFRSTSATHEAGAGSAVHAPPSGAAKSASARDGAGRGPRCLSSAARRRFRGWAREDSSRTLRAKSGLLLGAAGEMASSSLRGCAEAGADPVSPW